MIFIFLEQLVLSVQKTIPSFHEKAFHPIDNMFPQLLACKKVEKANQDDGSLLLKGTTFADCIDESKEGGAAIMVKNFISKVEDCTFKELKAIKGIGGAIYIEENSYIKSTTDHLINKCKFESCQSLSGGAISSVSLGTIGIQSKISITNCQFNMNNGFYSHNESEVKELTAGSRYIVPHGYGGAILVGFFNADIKGCTFHDNSALHGANIATYLMITDYKQINIQSKILIDDCEIEFSSHEDGEDSIYFRMLYDNSISYSATPPSITMSNCRIISGFKCNDLMHFYTDYFENGIGPPKFDYNNGNCIDNPNSTSFGLDFFEWDYITFDTCAASSIPEIPNFIEETCQSDETKTRIRLRQNTTISNCKFSQLQDLNKAGGAIYSYNHQLLLNNCTFSECKASLGGAIYFFNDYSCNRFEHCVFEQCCATSGGAIYAISSELSKNSQNNVANVVSCHFISNRAIWDLNLNMDMGCGEGGAIFTNINYFGVSFSIFDNNDASLDGSNIAWHLNNVVNGTMQLKNCSLKFDQSKDPEYPSSSSVSVAIPEDSVKNADTVQFALSNNKIINTFDSQEKFHFSLHNKIKLLLSSNCVDTRKGETKLFDKYTNKFDQCPIENTLQFSESTQFTDSMHFSESPQFTNSISFSESTQFTNSISFSESPQFTNSISFSTSKQFTNSISFSYSAFFSDSFEFSQSKSLKPTIDGEEGDSDTGAFESSSSSSSDSTSNTNSIDKDASTSGNKNRISGTLIGIIVAIVTLVILMITLLFFVLRKRKRNKNADEFQDDDDKNFEMSMSRVSVESNIDFDRNSNPDSFEDIKDIDPFQYKKDDFEENAQ